MNFAYRKWRKKSKPVVIFPNWTSAISDIFSSGYFHNRNARCHVVTSLRTCIFFMSTKFVQNLVSGWNWIYLRLWLRSRLILLNLCETVRSQMKTMFTRVKMSAVLCHRESTAKSMENCPWPKNRRLCPTKNDVRYYTGILLKIEENICSRMLQDSIWIKWLEFQRWFWILSKWNYASNANRQYKGNTRER